MRLERLTWKFLPKASTLGDVTDWSSVISGSTVYIENGISWLLELEPSFCSWPMGAWLPSVPCYLTDSLSVLLGTLPHKTIYSSEDWGPWTDDDSSNLTLPTIFSLALLKHVHRLLAVNHSSSNTGLSSWSNMTCILEFLDVTILIQTSGSTAVLFTTVDNM